MIKQVWHPYWLWEDCDMYRPSKIKSDEGLNNAVRLLTDLEDFEKTARLMVHTYKYACEHNLTNPSMNKIAYIGQASCFFKYGVKEDETRKAWGTLTEEQRVNANAVADKILKEWENEYIENVS